MCKTGCGTVKGQRVTNVEEGSLVGTNSVRSARTHARARARVCVYEGTRWWIQTVDLLSLVWLSWYSRQAAGCTTGYSSIT